MALPPRHFPDHLPPAQMLILAIEYYLVGNELFGRTAIEIAFDKSDSELSSLGIDPSLYKRFKEGLTYNKMIPLPKILPPPSVPEGLTKEEYFELGKSYKAIGWTEQSREALGRAMDATECEEFKLEVKQYLTSHLPKFPVPHKALERNIKAANLILEDPQKSAKLFLSLIEDYPLFEYPYSNLAFAYLKLGKLDKAVPALEEVLMLNSSYYNAWLNLAKARALDDDYERAYDCLKKASLLYRDPDLETIEAFVKEMKRLALTGKQQW